MDCSSVVADEGREKREEADIPFSNFKRARCDDAILSRSLTIAESAA
jgi:hypothetical protein